MRKAIKSIVIALAAIALLASCGTDGSGFGGSGSQSGLPDIVRNARRNAPENTLIGIGSAKLATQAQSKTIAETRARAEIARAMDSMVQGMVRDYQASNEVDPQAAISFQENITTSLTRANLQGAVIADEDYIDGTYYVVMYLNKANVVREISQAQAAARLAVPAMASFNAEARMNEAFDRQAAMELQVRDN
jgi:hypothetical protein